MNIVYNFLDVLFIINFLKTESKYRKMNQNIYEYSKFYCLFTIDHNVLLESITVKSYYYL